MKNTILLGIALFFSYSFLQAQYVKPVRYLRIDPAYEVIEMDGILDDSYSEWQYTTIAKREGAAIDQYEDGDDFDFNAQFALTWDYDYLYLFIDVTDDVKEYYTVGKSEGWTWDNVEIFIDLDTNSATNTYADTSTVQIRLTPGLKKADESADSLVDWAGRAEPDDYKYFVDADDPTGYVIEIAIPWIAAAASSETMESFDIMSKICAYKAIGFDISVADSDGDGSGDTGNRNTTGAGGAQMFWDLDTNDPLDGNEDNAYQNRRVFGLLGFNSRYHCSEPNALNNVPATATTRIYPNPTKDIIRIAHYSGPVKACNVYGEVIVNETYTGQTLDFSELPSGTYFMITESGIHKFLKY